MNRQYIGARYVPTFANPIEWDKLRGYEAMTIVTYQGTSYTSKIPVPAGVELDNEKYWVVTGNYNAQVEQYRQETVKLAEDVKAYKEETDKLTNDVSYLQNYEQLNSFKDKNILVLGDSISDVSLFPDSWVTSFTEKMQSVGASVTNVSLQGRTIAKYSESGNNTLLDILPSISGQYDLIIVALGVNDYFNQLPLGYFYDTSGDGTTVCSALVEFNSWITANNPTAKVTWISPLKTKREGFLGSIILQSYIACIYANATFFGWQFIDAHSFAPLINPYVQGMSNWQSDGIHPVAAYGVHYSEWIIKNLMSGCSTYGKINYTLRIEDALSTSEHVEVRADEYMNLSYYVHDFPINATGNIKIADIPAQYTADNTVYGMGWLTGYGSVVLTTVGSALYAVIPDGASSGTLNGDTTISPATYTMSASASL